MPVKLMPIAWISNLSTNGLRVPPDARDVAKALTIKLTNIDEHRFEKMLKIMQIALVINWNG